MGQTRTAAIVLLHIAAALLTLGLFVGLVATIVLAIANSVDPIPVYIRAFPPRVLTVKELTD